MRRLLSYTGVLCAAVIMAVLGTRLAEAQHTAHTQDESRLAAAETSLEELYGALSALSLCEAGPSQAHSLLTVARAGNTARAQLAALPLNERAAALVTDALNDMTGQADALLCTMASGAVPTQEAWSSLLHGQALCSRLLAGLEAAQAMPPGTAPDSSLSSSLIAAVCCDGAHDTLVPVLQRPAPRGLPEKLITREEALLLAQELVDGEIRSVQAAPDTGGMLPAYGVTVDTDDLRLNLEITRQGGQLLWMMP